ncbi:MAG: hypothetical protein IJP38_00660 [Oscillospiraceae bacterium]|nr:hypothetical protein [Oscillospiraceae bacterium]
MGKHYNLSKKMIPGAIIIDDKRCFFSDYHTTTNHERILKKVSDMWRMTVEHEVTVLADTDGGCDRTEYVIDVHTLDLSEAIFDEDIIIGFYLDLQRWDGNSEKPNSHIFILDDVSTHTYHTSNAIWKLEKK